MKRPLFWLVLFSLIFVIPVLPGFAIEKAKIKDLTVVVGVESLGVSFVAENCFSPKIEEMIQNGVPATMTFSVRLGRTRKFWKDKRLGSTKIIRRIHHDNIKEEYQIFMRETGSPISIKDFAEAKQKIARVENVSVIPPAPMDDGKTYHISVKAEIEPISPPFRLQSLLFFIPSAKRETDWFSQSFKVGSFVVPKKQKGSE